MDNLTITPYQIIIFCRHPTGLVAALQTDEKYFGHGYAALVIKAISKKIARTGSDIFAGILEYNCPSLNLFGKLGKVHYLSTKINWTEADD